MNLNSKKVIDLVADIGGTNSRLAYADQDDDELKNICICKNHDFESLLHVIKNYLLKSNILPGRVCLAVAGPPVQDFVQLTNCPW
ncbi:MAG: glucokinase, partial [Pseudobdellovibrionaceae bacterium]